MAEGDYGLYVCKAENEAGSVEHEISITENRGSSVVCPTRKENKGESLLMETYCCCWWWRWCRCCFEDAVLILSS